MTVPSTTNRNDYVGTGAVSIYPYTYKIFDKSELKVTERNLVDVEAELVEGTDYTVGGVGDLGGGDVTLTAAHGPLIGDGTPANSHLLTIRRVLAQTQLTDIRNQGDYFPETIEDTFDRSRMVDQQQQDELDRSMRLPETVDPGVVSAELPIPTALALIRWNGTADQLEAVTGIDGSTLTFVGGNSVMVRTGATELTGKDLLAGVGMKIDDADGQAAAPKYTLASKLFQGRLTLESGVPVSTTDQTAKTTVYLTPYAGNLVSLYDGSSDWEDFALTEISVAVPASTGTNYDVFVYDSSGLTVEAVAWSNDTTRATALVLQDGVLVKSGATARRYVGTFRTTGVSGQTEDSLAKRFIWNYYNRVEKPMQVVDTTDSWTYSSATFRQANAAAANQLDFVIGVDEDPASARVLVTCDRSGGGNGEAAVAVGVDSTSVKSGINTMSKMASGGDEQLVTAEYKGHVGVGRHFLAWLENSPDASGINFKGDEGGTSIQSGIIGSIYG